MLEAAAETKLNERCIKMNPFSELYSRYAIPLDGYTIATEADDVTQTVARQMGGARAPTNRATDERAEDLTQTDNIFADAHEGDEDAPPQPETPEDQDDQTDNPENPPEDGETDNLDDGAGDGEDPPPEDGETDDSLEDESAPQSVYSDKNTLKDNIIYFTNILRTDIDELTNVLGGLNDLESIQVVNSVITNMRNCKDVLHKTLTNDMETSSYEELMRKYITVKRIYDISIEMLDKHFSNMQKKPIRRKSKRTKIKV